MFENTNDNFETQYAVKPLYEPTLSLSEKSITDGLAFALDKAYDTESVLVNRYINSYVSNKGQKRLKALYEKYKNTCEELGIADTGGFKQIYYIALLVIERYEIARLKGTIP